MDLVIIYLHLCLLSVSPRPGALCLATGGT